MSPRGPRLRNRKKIKVPKRFDEYEISPRKESPEESEESPDLKEEEEEMYEAPKSRKRKPQRRPAYRGEVIEFNPNLPPAAFPTLDHPSYVHNGGNIPFDLESPSLGLQSQELAGFESISSNYSSPKCHSAPTVDLPDSTEDPPASTTTPADFDHLMLPNAMQRPNMDQSKARGSMISSRYGESTDSGPRNPIWADNMERMEAAGKMSDSDRFMLEMETSDEEDTPARTEKVAKKAGVPAYPAWDDLTITHKLDLADVIGEIYPDVMQVTIQLRLDPSQKEELIELLTQRQDRAASEEENQQRLMEQTRNIILQGKRLSQSEYRKMVEENLYRDIEKYDYRETNMMELKRARSYLKWCGFNPALADHNWNVPSASDAPSGTEPRPAPNKPEASLSNAAAHTLPSPSEEPSSQRSAPSTSYGKSPYLPGPGSEPVQQHPQGVTPQYSPNPAHAIIARHSRAAPLSKVPGRPFPVAGASQSGDSRARYQGTMRAQQPSISASQLPSKASTDTDRRANRKKVPTASGGSSDPTNPQEGNSSPAGLPALAPKGVPIAPSNHKRQRGADASAEADAEASAPQGNGATVDSRDTINKRGKKGAARTGLES